LTNQTLTKPSPFSAQSQLGPRSDDAGVTAAGESIHNEGVSALSNTARATNLTNQTLTRASPFISAQSQLGPRSDDAGLYGFVVILALWQE
jgi:hypothetical protein